MHEGCYRSLTGTFDTHTQYEEKSYCAWVGNIPFDTKDKDIRDLFESHGLTVNKVVLPYTVRRKDTGPQKLYRGYAFVLFPDEQTLQRAIATVHGTQLQDRTLIVSMKGTTHISEEQTVLHVPEEKKQKKEPDASKDDKQKNKAPSWKQQDDGDYSKQIFCSRCPY
jgi:RNA recognition motif-containing protein